MRLVQNAPVGKGTRRNGSGDDLRRCCASLLLFLPFSGRYNSDGWNNDTSIIFETGSSNDSLSINVKGTPCHVSADADEDDVLLFFERYLAQTPV